MPRKYEVNSINVICMPLLFSLLSPPPSPVYQASLQQDTRPLTTPQLPVQFAFSWSYPPPPLFQGHLSSCPPLRSPTGHTTDHSKQPHKCPCSLFTDGPPPPPPPNTHTHKHTQTDQDPNRRLTTEQRTLAML